MRWLLVAGAVMAVAGPARADDRTTWDRVIEGDQQAKEPKRGQPPAGLTEYQRQIWLGDYYAGRLNDAGIGYRRRLSDTAMNAYRKAAALDPDNPTPHYRLGTLIDRELKLDRWHGAQERVWRDRVIKHWETFEQLAPLDPRIIEVLRSRSLEYTKLGTKAGYRKALGDYDRLLLLEDIATLYPEEGGRLASNRAEIHMMLGEMPQAIEWYTRALELHHDNHWGYGLAVAYDRDGHALRAREVMRRFATRSTVALFVEELRTGATFFVPPGEVYYYFALIHETFGNYDLAIDAYRTFVASGAHPAFHQRASRNIARLRKELAAGRGRQPARHWSRTWQREAGF